MNKEILKLEREIYRLKIKLKESQVDCAKCKRLSRDRKVNNDKLSKDNERLRYKYEAAKQRADGVHLHKKSIMNKFLMGKV